MIDLRNETVSTATLRDVDLMRSFCMALDQIDPWKRKYADLISEASLLVSIGDDNWTQDEGDRAMFALSELFDALDTFAPDNFYFGAHPGNSSEIGFWECEPDLDYDEPTGNYPGMGSVSL